jgi:hypothetical protein
LEETQHKNGNNNIALAWDKVTQKCEWYVKSLAAKVCA